MKEQRGQRQRKRRREVAGQEEVERRRRMREDGIGCAAQVPETLHAETQSNPLHKLTQAAQCWPLTLTMEGRCSLLNDVPGAFMYLRSCEAIGFCGRFGPAVAQRRILVPTTTLALIRNSDLLTADVLPSCLVLQASVAKRSMENVRVPRAALEPHGSPDAHGQQQNTDGS